MSVSDSYQYGRAEGEHWADQDVRERIQETHHWILKFREDAAAALNSRKSRLPDSETWAAYCLGVARGYRSVAR